MIHRLFLAAATIISASAPSLPPDQPTLLSWPESQREAVISHEQRLIDSISPDRLRAWHDLLGSEPHVAGTPGDRRTIERIAAAFSDMGLDVHTHDFWPLLCRPTALTLEVITPQRIPLFAKEDILAEDPDSANPELLPGWNAYSGNGDVTAEIVYANYGTKEDFNKLAELGIDVRGKIVLARYGGNFRGYKARYAEEAGAAGLVIYTDPADSGYCKGLVYPEGGYANDSCIQRGSIITIAHGGDPLTPNIEATKEASRLDIADLGLPNIPVTPIGWGAAQQIIGRMKGPPVQQGAPGWQGGLPFTYRLTGGPELTVRLHVEQERFIGRTANVVARLEGETEPEKLVIIGCHHDAWGFGASDPLAGTICLMETARVLTDAARQGHRPRRTVLFCAWGAEEFGIIGSGEWVEANRDNLIKNAVAYINLDMAAMGPDFGCAATPSMQQLIADVSRQVPSPSSPSGRGNDLAQRDRGEGVPRTTNDAAPPSEPTQPRTVFDAWLGRGEDPLTKSRPRFGNLGGGSDHEAFVAHVATSSAGLSAGGSPGTAYHSTYDTLNWYRRTVGDDYQPATMITGVTTLAAHRLAAAPIIPLDPARYAIDLPRHLDDLVKRANDLKWPIDARGTPRDEQITALRKAADAAAAHLRAAHESRRHDPADIHSLRAHNDAILRADRAWLTPDGLPDRPWFRNLYMAPDEDSGYASWPLPELRRAVERQDDQAFTKAIQNLKTALERMSEN